MGRDPTKPTQQPNQGRHVDAVDKDVDVDAVDEDEGGGQHRSVVAQRLRQGQGCGKGHYTAMCVRNCEAEGWVCNGIISF